MVTRYTIAVALATFLLAGSYFASKPKPVASHILTRFERTGTTLDGWGWAALPWTGDDKPYQKIRGDIDKAPIKGRNPSALISAYKDREEYDSQNSLAVFGWGMARWRAATWPGDYQEDDNNLIDLPDVLAEAPFPRTYNYARLRFLVQSQVRAMPQLRELGERLVKYDPSDVDAKYQLIRVLRQTQSFQTTPLPENVEALKLAQELMTQSPKELRYRQVFANIQGDAYMQSGFKKEYGDRALAAYEDYLQMAPPDDPERDGIKRAIVSINQNEANTK